MSEIEDKILGIEKKNSVAFVKKNVFETDAVWFVSKEGCGKNLINGVMAYEMLSPDGKRKALKGNKKISDHGFVFERKI